MKQAVESPFPIATSVKPFRVIVVEDDRVVFTGLNILLKHYNYQVEIAETLRCARKALQMPADLICLDLTLPDGDGAELLQELKHSGINIPVIVSTACDDEARLRRVRHLRPELLLKKPIDFLQLLECIQVHATAALKPVSTSRSLF